VSCILSQRTGKSMFHITPAENPQAAFCRANFFLT